MLLQKNTSYLPLIEDVSAYAERHQSILSTETLEAIEEIKARLKTLDRQYARLLELNELLRNSNPMSILYDEHSGDFRVCLPGGFEQVFQIPGISGLNLIDQGSFGDMAAFRAGGTAKLVGPEETTLFAQLEELIEAYYYGAHRLTVLVRKLPKQKKFVCHGISIVRNKLLEHTEKEVSYHFGYGSGGPFVRPIRPANSPWRDAGVVSNTTAYIAMLHEVFKA